MVGHLDCLIDTAHLHERTASAEGGAKYLRTFHAWQLPIDAGLNRSKKIAVG